MSFNDSSFLASDPTFQNRVGSAMFTYCGVVSAESPSASAGGAFIHDQRKNLVANILNNPTNYKPLFADVVSADTSVVSDATVGGTVPLTAGNVAAQGLLVTDTHISNAVAANFNNFIAAL